MVKIDPVSFSIRLKDARHAVGLTQQQLADLAGVTDKAVSAWENGQTEGILAANLFSVADALHVDARWLATGDGSSRPFADEILAGLNSLPAEQLDAVRSLIRSLKR